MGLVDIRTPLNLEELRHFARIMHDWRFPYDTHLSIYSILLFNAVKIDLLSEGTDYIPEDMADDFYENDEPIELYVEGYIFIIHNTDEKPNQTKLRP